MHCWVNQRLDTPFGPQRKPFSFPNPTSPERFPTTNRTLKTRHS